MLKLVDGVLVEMTPEEEAAHTGAPPFTATDREALKARVDSDAEQVRLQFVTPGAAMQLVYGLKREESARWLALYPIAPDPEPADADWPLLAAELDITAPTKHGVAQTISVIAAQWLGLASAIERKRLVAKAAIDAAADRAAAEAAAIVDWGLSP